MSRSTEILEQLLSSNEPRIRNAFLRSVAELTNGVQINRLVEALRSGSIAQALEALNLTETAYGPILEAVRSAYVEIGQETASVIGATDSDGYNVRVRFNVRDLEAEEWLRYYSSTRVVQITEDQREAIRVALTNGMADGVNPREMALNIVGRIEPGSNERVGGLIGLDSTKAEWVENARRELLSGDPAQLRNYLNRERRDARFDSRVETAIETGEPLSRDDVARITGRYADRLLKLRGETIGRTEALQALNGGQYAAYAQAVKEGKVPANAITKRWKSAADGNRVRRSHQNLHNETVGFNDVFRSMHGSEMLHPGDRSKGARARDIINCRCVCEYKIDFIKARLGANPRTPKPPTEPPAGNTPTLAQQLRKINKDARDSVMRNGKRDGVEFLLAIDADTAQQATRGSRGGRSHVNFSEDLIRIISDPNRRIIGHHNHPSSSSLSFADIRAVKENPGLIEVWAHGHNGNRFGAMSVRPDFEQRHYDRVRGQIRQRIQSEIWAYFPNATDAQKKRFMDAANVLDSHFTNLALSRHGFFEYKATLDANTKRIMREFPDLIRDLDWDADRINEFMEQI